MMCEVCAKKLSFGHNVSHSKRRTNRIWRPNIQRATVPVNGQLRQISVCTRCLRTMQKVRD